MLTIDTFEGSMPFTLASDANRMPGRAARRRAHLLAFHILERLDRARRLGDQRKRRRVVDHVDHDRLLARLGAGHLDDRVHVAEAGIVGARRDAADGCGRAGALVDVDVEALGGEIALVLGPEHVGMDALVLPVQREPDLGLVLRGGAGQRHQDAQRSCSKPLDQHGSLRCWSYDQPIANSSLRRAHPVTRTSMNEKMT